MHGKSWGDTIYYCVTSCNITDKCTVYLIPLIGAFWGMKVLEEEDNFTQKVGQMNSQRYITSKY